MKILDKYIVKSFLIGYVISFCVLIGLRIVIDLFINLDEFTENAKLDNWEVIKHILSFYGIQCTLYFRDFAGMITVVAAAFSLGKMIRSNELVAVMASGVSLKRVIAPIIILALLLTGLLVIDQEFIIPPNSDKLVRSHDDIPGQESYDIWFIEDDSGSLICSQRFKVKTSTLFNPTILVRKQTDKVGVYEVRRRITADRAVYNTQEGRWDLVNGRVMEKGVDKGAEPIDSYSCDITPKDIPIMCEARNKTLLSWLELRNLAAQKTKTRDLAQLYSQMHFHVTEPVINLVMLMVCLPVLVCRDPKAMKSSVAISFALTGVFFVIIFVCKMLATEVVFFDMFMPELWAWLPIFIFLPIAFLEMDSMKT